jgi:arylsulfatase A-like enzyme
MLKKPLIYFFLLVLIFSFYHCGKNPDFKNIDPTFLWENSQSHISPDSGTKHLWSGFKIQKDFFLLHKNIGKFILWRDKKEETEITLHYLLRGMSSDVFVNSQKAFNLKPRYRLKQAKPFKTRVSLEKGFNFLEFRKRGQSQLKIKSLGIGDKPKTRDFHLSGAEKITRYYPAGSGTISFKGNGQLHVKQVEFIDGKPTSREKEFDSGTVTFPIEFQTLGFLQFSAPEGQFVLIDHVFNERPARTGKVKKTIANKPHIFIFLIDGCHASHLGIYGYHRDTSPYIDEFARDSVVFDNAYANATFTRSSVATIFTGFYPHRHKLRILSNRLPKGLFMLPEFLKKNGYQTAVLTEAGNISKFFGFAQGVDNYRKIFRRWDDPRYLENNLYKYFSQWLATSGQLFTYVHFRAPHLPIIPPSPFLDMYKEKKSPGPQERVILDLVKLGKAGHRFTPAEVADVIADYDSTIRYVDAEVGKMLKTLKEKGLYDSSLIIFTSDHGEAMYEHEYWGHGRNVYNETSRVPLVVKFPQVMQLKGRIARIAQLADLFPTIAAWFGEQRYFDGQSLLESIKIKSEDDRFAFSTSFEMPPSLGIRWRSWYYILHRQNNKEELYHLTTAPLQDAAALAKNKDILTFFRAKFLDWLIDFDNLERTAQSVDLKKLPQEEYNNLKSLGYID